MALLLSPGDFDRVSDVVKRVEGMADDTAGTGRTASPRGPIVCLVRIPGGTTPDGSGRYAGKLQTYDVDTDTFADVTDGDVLVKPIN